MSDEEYITLSKKEVEIICENFGCMQSAMNDMCNDIAWIEHMICEPKSDVDLIRAGSKLATISNGGDMNRSALRFSMHTIWELIKSKSEKSSRIERAERLNLDELEDDSASDEKPSYIGLE